MIGAETYGNAFAKCVRAADTFDVSTCACMSDPDPRPEAPTPKDGGDDDTTGEGGDDAPTPAGEDAPTPAGEEGDLSGAPAVRAPLLLSLAMPLLLAFARQ